MQYNKNSCLSGPRDLERKHVRMVTTSGLSAPLDEYYERRIPVQAIK